MDGSGMSDDEMRLMYRHHLGWIDTYSRRKTALENIYKHINHNLRYHPDFEDGIDTVFTAITSGIEQCTHYNKRLRKDIAEIETYFAAKGESVQEE